MLFEMNKETLVRCVNVILRVPALFIAEAWYRTDPNLVHSQLYVQSKGSPALVNIEKKHHALLIETIYYAGNKRIRNLSMLFKWYRVCTGIL